VHEGGRKGCLHLNTLMIVLIMQINLIFEFQPKRVYLKIFYELGRYSTKQVASFKTYPKKTICCTAYGETLIVIRNTSFNASCFEASLYVFPAFYNYDIQILPYYSDHYFIKCIIYQVDSRNAGKWRRRDRSAEVGITAKLWRHRIFRKPDPNLHKHQTEYA